MKDIRTRESNKDIRTRERVRPKEKAPRTRFADTPFPDTDEDRNTPEEYAGDQTVLLSEEIVRRTTDIARSAFPNPRNRKKDKARYHIRRRQKDNAVKTAFRSSEHAATDAGRLSIKTAGTFSGASRTAPGSARGTRPGTAADTLGKNAKAVSKAAKVSAEAARRTAAAAYKAAAALGKAAAAACKTIVAKLAAFIASGGWIAVVIVIAVLLVTALLISVAGWMTGATG